MKGVKLYDNDGIKSNQIISQMNELLLGVIQTWADKNT